ncbi:hypothetical protein GPECTOR_7g1258 [Gonium pectorale]|uniref:Uncharacterized protein n=1 Tax=Gonium pectorale TaxID=33097 RepID=A0A150GUE1_GONPE|nr:hypothetical protein GPECTOR_7g1258 [Gonium pectorale]|eukprot:KXZ53362.1 hypothetical protein GPECTOR_7g1258 [Gonium pectorale]
MDRGAIYMSWPSYNHHPANHGYLQATCSVWESFRASGTVAELQALNGQQINVFLQFYGVPTTGIVAERRVRLALTLGVHLVA